MTPEDLQDLAALARSAQGLPDAQGRVAIRLDPTTLPVVALAGENVSLVALRSPQHLNMEQWMSSLDEITRRPILPTRSLETDDAQGVHHAVHCIGLRLGDLPRRLRTDPDVLGGRLGLDVGFGAQHVPAHPEAVPHPRYGQHHVIGCIRQARLRHRLELRMRARSGGQV